MPSHNEMLFDVERHKSRLRTIAARCTETARTLEMALDAVKDANEAAKCIVDDLLDTMQDASEAAVAVDQALARRLEDAVNCPMIAVPVDVCTCGTPHDVHTTDCPRYPNTSVGGSDDYIRKQVYGR